MKTKKTDGLAFPLIYSRGRVTNVHTGMTLRLWLAGQALNGYLAGRNNQGAGMDSRCEQVATACLAYADAIIKEASK